MTEDPAPGLLQADPPARRVGWRGLASSPGLADGRADLGSAVRTTILITLAGVPAGLLWWLLAPRADYQVTADGVTPIGSYPSDELFAADDGVFVCVLAGLGLLAGIAVWLRRRRRGVVLLAGGVVGCVLAGVVAWQLGHLLGPSPTQDELADVGARVTTGLNLHTYTALLVAPFVLLLVHVIMASATADDELNRSPRGQQPPVETEPAGQLDQQ